MSPQDLKSLQNLYKLMRNLESGAPGSFHSSQLQEVQKQLESFAVHESPELQRLSEIAKHLHPEMSLKHYVSWLVPLERLLQKSLRDDEFLIFSEDGARALAKIPLVFVLHNIRSAFNVGSIFRTAECFGAEKVYLCGYTPLPTQEKLAKTAMGTEALVEWQEAPKILELLSELKKQNYHLVALETTSHAVNLNDNFPDQPTAFVLGNERFGLDPEVLELCSEVRSIPLRGQKNSLNVGVAAAIAAYEFARQRS